MPFKIRNLTCKDARRIIKNTKSDEVADLACTDFPEECACEIATHLMKNYQKYEYDIDILEGLASNESIPETCACDIHREILKLNKDETTDLSYVEGHMDNQKIPKECACEIYQEITDHVCSSPIWGTYREYLAATLSDRKDLPCWKKLGKQIKTASRKFNAVDDSRALDIIDEYWR